MRQTRIRKVIDHVAVLAAGRMLRAVGTDVWFALRGAAHARAGLDTDHRTRLARGITDSVVGGAVLASRALIGRKAFCRSRRRSTRAGTNARTGTLRRAVHLGAGHSARVARACIAAVRPEEALAHRVTCAAILGAFFLAPHRTSVAVSSIPVIARLAVFHFRVPAPVRAEEPQRVAASGSHGYRP